MKKRGSLLLVELMIALFVFCVACGVSLQSFAKSSSLSKDADDLNHAVTIVESTAEQLKANKKDSISYYYDSDWNTCNEDEAYFVLVLQETKSASSLKQCNISIFSSKEEKTIYSLEYEYTTGGTSYE